MNNFTKTVEVGKRMQLTSFVNAMRNTIDHHHDSEKYRAEVECVTRLGELQDEIRVKARAYTTGGSYVLATAVFLPNPTHTCYYLWQVLFDISDQMYYEEISELADLADRFHRFFDELEEGAKDRLL